MLLNDLIYEDGDYLAYYNKSAGCFVIVKNGLVCGTIVGHASTFEQAKESIELYKKED